MRPRCARAHRLRRHDPFLARPGATTSQPSRGQLVGDGPASARAGPPAPARAPAGPARRCGGGTRRRGSRGHAPRPAARPPARRPASRPPVRVEAEGVDHGGQPAAEPGGDDRSRAARTRRWRRRGRAARCRRRRAARRRRRPPRGGSAPRAQVDLPEPDAPTRTTSAGSGSRSVTGPACGAAACRRAPTSSRASSPPWWREPRGGASWRPAWRVGGRRLGLGLRLVGRGLRLVGARALRRRSGVGFGSGSRRDGGLADDGGGAAAFSRADGAGDGRLSFSNAGLGTEVLLGRDSGSVIKAHGVAAMAASSGGPDRVQPPCETRGGSGDGAERAVLGEQLVDARLVESVHDVWVSWLSRTHLARVNDEVVRNMVPSARKARIQGRRAGR